MDIGWLAKSAKEAGEKLGNIARMSSVVHFKDFGT
jgi:hypothetical protein